MKFKLWIPSSPAEAFQSLWEVIRGRRKSLILLFATYVPACMVAAYLGQWIWQTYLLGFAVASCYGIWLLYLAVSMTIQLNQRVDLREKR